MKWMPEAALCIFHTKRDTTAAVRALVAAQAETR